MDKNLNNNNTINYDTYKCVKTSRFMGEVKVRPWSFEEEIVLKKVMSEMKIDNIATRIPTRQISEHFNRIMINIKGKDYGARSDSSIRTKCISILSKQSGRTI